MAIHRRSAHEADEDLSVVPRFTRAGMLKVPKNRLPDGEMLPQTAYQIITDEVMLDGNARFNRATFVTTWMDDEADRLYAATFDKNMIDRDEYPQTAEIEARCVRMLADLWHAPQAAATVGTSTTGSSEGCMLGGLAMKRRWQHSRWQHSRRQAGRPADRPNIVMGANVQVVWEKFANYWDVEPRYVPLEGSVLHLTADRLLPYVDENTIGVVAVLGSTMDGSYEPVQEICAVLDDYEARTGVSVPVHVDAASGGFVAPFVQPDLVWDFQLPRVVSIQTSGHKYGLVYPGVGWVLWRDAEHLPEDLVFHVNYLGGDMPTFALNFSRPGAQVVLQYFQFLRLGRDGFRLVQRTCQEVAMRIAEALAGMPEFSLISKGRDLPVVTFAISPEVTKYDVYDVSRKLRESGWLVPAYTMPPKREDLAVLRVVVRNGFSHDMADLFLRDLRTAVDWLDGLTGPMPHEAQPSGFHH
ncbi:MAG TPA: glutamate decarboxylase [Nocardioidaceae bacterium]|nr:glutamate decarboxylase [Nocardioidaceae bacterium]